MCTFTYKIMYTYGKEIKWYKNRPFVDRLTIGKWYTNICSSNFEYKRFINKSFFLVLNYIF